MSAAHLYIFVWSQIKFSEVETEELRFGEQCAVFTEHTLYMNGTKETNTKLYFKLIQGRLYNVDWTGAFKHISVCLFKSFHSFPFLVSAECNRVPMVYCLY